MKHKGLLLLGSWAEVSCLNVPSFWSNEIKMGEMSMLQFFWLVLFLQYVKQSHVLGERSPPCLQCLNS